MSLDIHLKTVRKRFKPRREPYWGPAIAQGLAVGYRKIDEQRGTWIARAINPAPPPFYLFHSLGLATDTHDYEAARAEALKWQQAMNAGVTERGFTIADACREYVEDRRHQKSEENAYDAEKRFRARVYDSALGRTPLEKLRAPALRKWLHEQKMSPASERRMLAPLKAAFNLAVRNRRVHPSAEIEWRDVHARAGTDKRRDLFLDRSQRQALLAHIPPVLRPLAEAAVLTGARGGELASATVSQFDPRTASMTFIGKTGARTVPLSPEAVRHFRCLTAGRNPDEHVFVTASGSRWHSDLWDKMIVEAARLAGLPKGVCMYTLRHSFITEALLGGMPTLEVARLVGTSVMQIEKHYGHLVSSVARERLAQVKML